MKYPKEHMKKAMDVIEENYFDADGNLDSVEILTMAVVCIGLLAYASKDDWHVDEDTAFEMVKAVIQKADPYEKE